jgi:hypothetical protein
LALQKQELLPAADVFVLLQLSHLAEPVAFLYDPTTHAVQGPPSGPVVPSGQTQPML